MHRGGDSHTSRTTDRPDEIPPATSSAHTEYDFAAGRFSNPSHQVQYELPDSARTNFPSSSGSFDHLRQETYNRSNPVIDDKNKK